MAANTEFTTEQGAPALGQKLSVVQMTVDIGETGTLAQGDHFELFTGATGDIVIGGGVTVLTQGTAGADYDIGIGGTGTQILADGQADAAVGTWTPAAAAAAAGGINISGDTVDFLCQGSTADLAAGKFLVTLIILHNAAF